MTASYHSAPYEPFTSEEDEFIERETDEMGDNLLGWRIWFRFSRTDAHSDRVSPSEASVLTRLDFDAPLTVKTRRRWLDAILVGRLLRAAPLTADDTLKWEPFLCDISIALDHFLCRHLRIEGNTEVGEAVLACVATVPRLQLRLQDYDLAAARPAAAAARRIIFEDYVLHLGREFPMTSPVKRIESAP